MSAAGTRLSKTDERFPEHGPEALMKKILIVEDDKLTAHIYSTHFKKEGFEPIVLPDGAALVKQFAELRPDAVLLDIMLPGLNGIEALKAIRALPNGQHIPVIAVTNAFVPQLVDAVKKAGANGVFCKVNVSMREITDAFRNARPVAA